MGYMIRGEPAPGRPEGAIEPDESLPRACVIGAGSCGITAAKALYEARVPFDCFEMGPVLGGLWAYQNPNGRSGCYSTLEMNTSGPRMSYSDFPFNDDDYPMHEAVLEYFERYVDHFGIRNTITFNTKVERVTRRDDGVFEVEIAGMNANLAAPGREAEEAAGVVSCQDGLMSSRSPIQTGSWKSRQLSAQSSGISLELISTRPSPAAASSSGSAGNSPGGP
jgi:NADPH-dependent 2,4-dienoyl-CoA reductase/sulfur reductase-like enzyme